MTGAAPASPLLSIGFSSLSNCSMPDQFIVLNALAGEPAENLTEPTAIFVLPFIEAERHFDNEGL